MLSRLLHQLKMGWSRFNWTERLLLLSIFLIPFDGRWRFLISSSRLFGEVGIYLVPELYFSDFAVMGFLLGSAWSALRRPRTRALPKGALRWAIIGIFLVLLSGIGATMWAYFPELSAYRLLRLCYYALWALGLARLLWPRRLVIAGSIALVVSAVVQVLLGWLQVIWQHSITTGRLANLIGEAPLDHYTPGVNFVRLWGEKVIRPYGTTDHPNMLAGFLLLGVLVVGYWVLVSQRERWRSRPGLILLFVILLSTIGLTLSRTTWVILGVWGGILLLSYPAGFARFATLLRRSRWFLPGLVLMGLMIGLVGWRTTSLFSVNQISLSGRLLLNGHAVQMMVDHPLGVGPSHFTLLLGYYDLSGAFDYFRQPVHQVFLLVGAEFGLFGLLGFFLLISSPILGLIRGITLGDGLRPLRYALLMAWVGVCITLFVDHYFWTLHTGQLLLWGLIGISLALIRQAAITCEGEGQLVN